MKQNKKGWICLLLCVALLAGVLCAYAATDVHEDENAPVLTFTYEAEEGDIGRLDITLDQMFASYALAALAYDTDKVQLVYEENGSFVPATEDTTSGKAVSLKSGISMTVKKNPPFLQPDNGHLYLSMYASSGYLNALEEEVMLCSVYFKVLDEDFDEDTFTLVPYADGFYDNWESSAAVSSFDGVSKFYNYYYKNDAGNGPLAIVFDYPGAPEPEPVPTPKPTPEPTTEPTTEPTKRPTSIGGNGNGGNDDDEPEETPAPTQTPEPTTEPTPEPAPKQFTDLDSALWAKEAIDRLSGLGIINGTSDTTFAPQNPIKRGDYILLLIKVFDIEDTTLTENFADVPEGSYYYHAIASAKAFNITTGVGDNLFMPESLITRQEMMTLTERALIFFKKLNATQDTAALDNFKDKADIAAWAAPSVANLVSNQLIAGADGNINPLQNTTRAEAAVFLNRIYDLMR